MATSTDMIIPASTPPFQYDPALEKYMISEKEYLKQNPQLTATCTGIAVFNEEGKLLLVQRSTLEKAYSLFWEVPGGKVEESDETILHGAVRELKEEAGLEATRIVRKVGEFTFRIPRQTRPDDTWTKHIFEVEVKDLNAIKLDPEEHMDHRWVTEEDIAQEKSGDTPFKYISPDNKVVKLAAFRRRREAAAH